MTRQRGVVRFDVHLEIVSKPVVPEEADHGLGVGIVLMVHGLHRLGFDQESAFKANRAAVVAGHAEETGHVVQLAAGIGVEQRAE